MPFCPKCRAEYIKKVEECPDCQVSLVDVLSPKDRDEYVEMVELEKVPDEVSGVMMKGILISNGIDAVLKASKIPWYNGIASTWSTFYWGILLVPEDELERSRKVLDEYLKSLEEDEVDDETKC
jgi:hypothetical protein